MQELVQKEMHEEVVDAKRRKGMPLITNRSWHDLTFASSFIAEASDDLLFRNPNHTEEGAWPDEEVDEEEEEDELDAETSIPPQAKITEEADMDNVETMMAHLEVEGKDEVGV
jgi:nicotinamidase-related amidase